MRRRMATLWATEVVTTTKVTKSGATWNGVEYQASLHP